MFKRIFVFLAFVSLAIVAGLYAFGQPGAAHQSWSAYQTAVQHGEFERAAELIDDEVLAFEDKMRRFAINAGEEELARLTTLELGYILGIRQAVAETSLPLSVVLAPESVTGFHAGLSRARPNKVLAEAALLAVLPLGPSRSIGWFGPREYANDLFSLAFSVAFGVRVNFKRDGQTWRIDYMPAMSASAQEIDAIGASAKGGTVEVMKRYYNAILANGNAAAENALWTPLSATADK